MASAFSTKSFVHPNVKGLFYGFSSPAVFAVEESFIDFFGLSAIHLGTLVG